ncbi:MAG: DUF6639 family protein [Hyphomicrobiaceae bacterium]
MLQSTRLIIWTIAWLALGNMAGAGSARAECGHKRVSTSGPASDTARVCEALNGVLRYFAAIGFTIEPDIRIVFRDRVLIDVYNADNREKAGKLQVSGFYNAAARVIEVTSGASTTREARRPWKQSWSADVSYSILQHELAHMAMRHALGQRYGGISKPWLEFTANAVQFDLMKPELRTAILASYPGLTPFASTDQVNGLTYGLDPDAFAVMAHLFVRANGGADFIRRLLIGEVDFNTEPTFWVR